ncbi:hypothetical protein ACFW04_010129 [Cataglyphis niger]
MPRNEAPQRSAGKRPLRALTPEEKLEAIRRVHEGESKASVARDIGVPESTLRGWCKAEHKIINQVNMKNSGGFEKITSSSESEENRSTPGAPSRPPSANLTSGPLTSGGKETSGCLEEVEPPTKRMKVENTDVPPISEPISPFLSSNIIHYLYAMMNPATFKNSYLGQQLIVNKALSNTLLDNTFSSSGYSINNASLGSTSMMSNMMSSTMSTPRDINGKKMKHRVNMPTSNTFARTSSKKQSLSPTGRENNLISIPSTSSGIVNSNHVAPTMSKPLQDGKHINDIAQQLLLQQQLKQQQSLNYSSELLSQWAHFEPTMRNILNERSVPTNSVNNNNNNIHKNNNQVENRKANSTLPPGIHEAADHGVKFVTWLRKYGSIFTFQQVKPVETIVEQIVARVKSKEIKSDDKANSMS